MKALITMNELSDINEFCKRAINVPVGVTVSRGKYVVDGSSVLGVISINPVEPITVEWDAETDEALTFTQFILALNKKVLDRSKTG